MKSLLDYLDGGLSSESQQAVCGHIEGCDACRGFLESYKKTTLLCRETILRATPSGSAERLIVYLRQETSMTGGKGKVRST